MKRFIWIKILQEKVQSRMNRYKGLFVNLIHSPLFFVSLYLILYGFHCLWNWDELMRMNRSLEMEAANSGKQVSLWSLYPFQVVSVIITSFLYFVFSLSSNLLFSFGGKTKKVFRANIGELFRNLIHQFFLFVCVLFIGNQFLGLFLNTNFYSLFVVMFWTSLFLLFTIQNGNLYKRLFVSSDRMVIFLSHSLGYVNPILFVFFVLTLANL